MKIKPEERPKVVGLAIGIALVLCLFGVNVFPRLLPHGPHGELLLGANRPTTSASTTAPLPAVTTPPTPAAGSSSSVGAAATTAAGGAVAAKSPAGTAATAQALVPTATTPDPFWRPLALSIQAQKPNSVPVRTPVVGLPKPSVFKPGFSPTSSPVKLAPIAPPPMPEVALQGIVQDETAIAVLEVGGQTRFMKAGETLEGGWSLSRIQTATIVLRQGRREVILTLGQSLPKEAPAVVPQENRDMRGIAQTLPPFHTVSLQP